MKRKFVSWTYPVFDEFGMTKWNWICQHPENLKLGRFCDIGAFTYINAEHDVEIGEYAQLGSHCSLYSISTIDGKLGKVVIKDNARIGTHSTIMPGVTIGKNSLIGAYSFVNKDIPDNTMAYGVPVKIVRKSIRKELSKKSKGAR